MTPELRAVTFDVYSALYDTPRGLAAALGSLLERRGVAGDPLAVSRVWRTKQREFLLIANSLDREPASNRQAIEASARYALRSLDPPLTADEVGTLSGAWERLPPWPEAAEVLSEVRRRGLVLATLSNGDEDMLRALLASLPVPFDHLISTQGGKFKPHPSAYRRALETLGVDAGQLLHVAGAATDAAGATAAGIRTVWVNRQADAVIDARFAPAHQGMDLRGLLPLLGG
ncbi:MAG: haloacid dehalogenase type II [bacterium]